MSGDVEVLEAFIAEFPRAHIVRDAMAGGEFEDAWDWLFNLTDKLRPAISDGLRRQVIDFFVNSDEEYFDWYIEDVREHLAKLPRKQVSAA